MKFVWFSKAKAALRKEAYANKPSQKDKRKGVAFWVWLDVLGITTKGLPCRIQVGNDQRYCHHHQWQNPNTPTINTPDKNPRSVNKPGYIYIYTYRHLYDSLIDGKSNPLEWLFIDDSVLTPTSVKKRQWDSKTHILCKIGMTTKSSVTTRLLEWQNTCKHPVVNLTPDKVYSLCYKESAKSKLSQMFRKLSINANKENNPESINLHTYRDGGFWVNGKGSQTLPVIENAIHKHLWRKLGQGLVYCHGCDPSGKRRHREWFKVAVKELPWLLQTVDSFCLGYMDGLKSWVSLWRVFVLQGSRKGERMGGFI